jgi:hypothetical protein
VGITALSLGAVAHGQASGKKKDTHKSVGFNLSADATEKDLGLPFYPGAKPYKGSDDNDSSLNVGFQGGSDAFKLVVMKLESPDSPEKIAAFYRKALNKYGTVLDCSKATLAAGESAGGKNDSDKNEEKNAKSNRLTCEDDDRTKQGYSYRSGTRDNMHVVGIEPDGKNTVISLVYVKSPEEKKSKE